MIDIILSVLLALFFLSLSFALGKKLLSFFSSYSLPLSSSLSFHEQILFSTVLGVSLFGLLFFFIGIFQLYSLWFFILFFLILLLIFSKDMFSFFPSMYSLIKAVVPSRYTSFFVRFCFLLLCFFVVANFFFSLTPEIQLDSLVYHLTQAKLYAVHHGLVDIPYDYHTECQQDRDALHK